MDIASRPPAVLARRRARDRRRPRMLWIIGICAAAILVGWWSWARTHPVDDLAGKIITAPVTRGDLVESVSATGSITAQTGAEVKIGSQITGRIKRLYADVGSHVSAGQVIAELDLPDIQAQLAQSQSSLAGAQTKLVQTELGVGQVRAQTSSAIAQAQANVRSSEARLSEAQAAARQQKAQTPTDIRRAQSGLAAAKAALSTARSTEKQTQASASLQIGSAQEQITQAQANATNASASYKRQMDLYKQGFVAAADVDTAKAQAAVMSSQVQSAQQNLDLVKEKVAADQQAARDGVTQAQQNVESAQAALVAAQAGTYTDAARAAAVDDAQEQVQQAQAALQAAEANRTNDVLKVQDVQAARDAVDTAKAQVAYQRAQVAKTQIRSPISGTVLQLAAQQGETLAAGLSAPTLIVVADLSRLQVDAYVDETDIGRVRMGQDADVTVDAFPHHVFKGKVTKVASGSTIQQGVVTYDVAVALQKAGEQLKPDMTASVTIQTGLRHDVLLVPSEAVNIGVRGSTVNVLTKRDGKDAITAVRVRTGGSDGVNTEITDGLTEGQTIVLAGADSGQHRAGPSFFGPAGGGGHGGGRKGG